MLIFGFTYMENVISWVSECHLFKHGNFILSGMEIWEKNLKTASKVVIQ